MPDLQLPVGRDTLMRGALQKHIVGAWLTTLPLLAVAAEPAEEPPIATLGEVSITVSDVDASLAYIPVQHRAGYMNDPNRVGQHLEAVLLRRAILHQADQRGFMDDFDASALRRSIEEEFLAEAYLDHETANLDQMQIERMAYDLYEQSKETLSTPPQVQVSHILVATDLRDDEAARQIVSEIQDKMRDGVSFADLVAEYSDDAGSKARQGRLTVSPGQMVKPFEEAAFGLEEDGAVSEPVKTEFGYHLIKRLDYKPSETPPFDAIAGQIRDRAERLLVDQRRQEIIDESENPYAELAERARALGLDQKEGFDHRIQLEFEKRFVEAYRERFLAATMPEDMSDLVEEYYLARPKVFREEATVEFQQIEILDEIHGEEARALAESVADQARAGADFGRLVAEYSDGPSKSRDRGMVERNTLHGLEESLRQAIFAVPQGEISEPLRSSKGYVIVKMLQQWPARKVPLDEVRESIAASLRQSLESDLWKRHVETFKHAPFWADPEAVASLRGRYLEGGAPNGESP